MKHSELEEMWLPCEQQPGLGGSASGGSHACCSQSSKNGSGHARCCWLTFQQDDEVDLPGDG